MQISEKSVEKLWAQLPQPGFGRAISLLRAAIDGAGRDLPREVLAGKMRNVATGYVGLDATTIWRWESGRTDARRHYRSMIGDVCVKELSRMDSRTRREFLEQLAVLAGAATSLAAQLLDREPP